MASRKSKKNRRRKSSAKETPLTKLEQLLASAKIPMVGGALLISGREQVASTLPDSDRRSPAVLKAVLELLDSSEECSRKIRHVSLKFPGASLYIRCFQSHVVVIEIVGNGEIDLAMLGSATQEFLSSIEVPVVPVERQIAVKRKVGGARMALSSEDIAALTGGGAFPTGAPVTGLVLPS